MFSWETGTILFNKCFVLIHCTKENYSLVEHFTRLKFGVHTINISTTFSKLQNNISTIDVLVVGFREEGVLN